MGPHLSIFVPGQALCREDEPKLLGSTFHYANVTDGEPALLYDLKISQEEEAEKAQWQHRGNVDRFGLMEAVRR